MRNAKLIIGAAIAFSLVLLLSGRRVLVWETTIHPGEVYNVPGFGRVGPDESTQFICTYFTGRSFKKAVYWLRDQCPFIVTDE
jgi:hypothetical protein